MTFWYQLGQRRDAREGSQQGIDVAGDVSLRIRLQYRQVGYAHADCVLEFDGIEIHGQAQCVLR
jgi:hypothetical protein